MSALRCGDKRRCVFIICGFTAKRVKLILPNNYSHQIHTRYEGKDISKHKRNLVIAGGVTLSVIVSPVVAAVTVGEEKCLCFVLFHHLCLDIVPCLYQHTEFKHVSPTSIFLVNLLTLPKCQS